jgi:hypothetical protein
VSEGAGRANQMLAEVATLERRAETLGQQATALLGAHTSWVEHLVERYQLDPERDQIDPSSGAIQRGAAGTEAS